MARKRKKFYGNAYVTANGRHKKPTTTAKAKSKLEAALDEAIDRQTRRLSRLIVFKQEILSGNVA